MFDINQILSSKPVIYALTFISTSLVLLWLTSIYWIYQDIFKRTKSMPLQIISIALSILFPFIGMLIYNMIRPAQTMEERRMQLLDEKILRQEVGGSLNCPNCRKLLNDDYVYCPNCRHKVKESCPKCDKVVDNKFNSCPFCGYELKMAAKTNKHSEEKQRET